MSMYRNRSKAEVDALRQVLKAGAEFGYGNCVQALSFAWARKMKLEQGMDDAGALAAGVVHEAWKMRPKKLSTKEAKVLMDFGDEILNEIF